jgi:adenylylsulfate kinase
MRALYLNGTVGVGKTSVADAVGDILHGRGIPAAVIDLDWLRNVGTAPDDDPFNSRIELANLRAVLGTYLDAGVTHVVLAGVMETAEGRAEYVRVLGDDLTVCRLDVALDVVRERLGGRHAAHDAHLAWHLDRAGELQGILEAASLEDAVVDATGLTIAEAAAAVLDAAHWP